MVGEALAAAIVGLVALWLVLQPLIHPSAAKSQPAEPVDPEETPKGIALTALKEIEFDRETGKLSDVDYEFLKAKYTAAALEALRLESAEPAWAEVSDDVEAIIAAKVRALRSASTAAPPDVPLHSTDSTRACSSCGPRPEPDAVFCSSCGGRLPSLPACDRCGAALQPDSRFCEACGQQVAA
jgi:methionine-rich copper-binding protein CopC/RNA polymerase subunit RPABC4/transcription elongation factor Spt4